jgi:hypothetical protein
MVLDTPPTSPVSTSTLETNNVATEMVQIGKQSAVVLEEFEFDEFVFPPNQAQLNFGGKHFFIFSIIF